MKFDELHAGDLRSILSMRGAHEVGLLELGSTKTALRRSARWAAASEHGVREVRALGDGALEVGLGRSAPVKSARVEVGPGRPSSGASRP